MPLLVPQAPLFYSENDGVTANLDILTHCGPVTQYGGGSMLCKNPVFFAMKKFTQILHAVIFLK